MKFGKIFWYLLFARVTRNDTTQVSISSIALRNLDNIIYGSVSSGFFIDDYFTLIKNAWTRSWRDVKQKVDVRKIQSYRMRNAVFSPRVDVVSCSSMRIIRCIFHVTVRGIFRKFIFYRIFLFQFVMTRILVSCDECNQIVFKMFVKEQRDVEIFTVSTISNDNVITEVAFALS